MTRNFTRFGALLCVLALLSSCGSMRTASTGFNDSSIHFVKPWTPGSSSGYENSNKFNNNPLPPRMAEGLSAKYAAMLGVSVNDIKNSRLYAFIDEWMGTPYALGGLSKMGIDCSGLVCLLEQSVYNAFGIPRSTNLQINYITRKDERDLKEGDLVFFNFGSKPCSHVGVYLQNGYVLHASVSKGVTITHLHSPSMYRYFATGGSVPGNYGNFVTASNNAR